VPKNGNLRRQPLEKEFKYLCLFKKKQYKLISGNGFIGKRRTVEKSLRLSSCMVSPPIVTVGDKTSQPWERRDLGQLPLIG
jgi:hypothetical protein